LNRATLVSTPIPFAALDALIDLVIAESGRETLSAHEVSDLLMAALALRTARRTGKQVFFVI
jgi:hypothetical protein